MAYSLCNNCSKNYWNWTTTVKIKGSAAEPKWLHTKITQDHNNQGPKRTCRLDVCMG